MRSYIEAYNVLYFNKLVLTKTNNYKVIKEIVSDYLKLNSISSIMDIINLSKYKYNNKGLSGIYLSYSNDNINSLDTYEFTTDVNILEEGSYSYSELLKVIHDLRTDLSLIPDGIIIDYEIIKSDVYTESIMFSYEDRYQYYLKNKPILRDSDLLNYTSLNFKILSDTIFDIEGNTITDYKEYLSDLVILSRYIGNIEVTEIG